ncbi:MAG TPA: hypothetical protein DDX85_06000, partial [Nitrospiraceae bacterium]|nr:hypothetical protein [Nitrospiraceae bacterium]
KDAVLGYFMPVSADIIHVEDRTVQVRPGGAIHVRKGMRFSVFREGAPFYHPVTNALIGRAEDFVGRIEITGGDTVEGVYPGMIISGDVREGDNARISSSRIKIAFFQDRKADWSVSEAFYGALKDSGRFEFVEAYTPDYSADTVSRLARGLGAEAALIFSTPEKNGKRFINIKLYWAEDAGVAGEIEQAARSDDGISPPEEEFIPGVFQETRPWRTFSLPGGLLIAMGDVDGNGSNEFAVSDGRNIRIYSVTEDFRELWNIKTEGEGSHLSLDILDVNNNGRAEIFVTSAVNPGTITTAEGGLSKDDMRLNSFILEYDPAEGYKRISENIPYFLRVLGKTLLMQRYSSTRIFGGPVYKAKWDGSQYQPSVPFVLPEGANIYGFAFVDWKNEGHADVMTYDNDGYLCLYNDNRVLKWKSEKSYGPFTFSFESRIRSLANPVLKWSVRGRLAVVKTARGQEIVAVSREQVLSVLPALGTHKAEVYSLWWDGEVMDRKLIMNEIYGSVTDYWIQGRELFLVARAGLSTFLGRLTEGEFSASSILFYYNFGPSDTEGPVRSGK